MDRYTRASLAVAPLQISKDRSQSGPSSPVQQQHMLTTTNNSWGVQHPGQMTPPLTPCDPEASFEKHHDFQTYLRAFYPYHPDCDQASSTVTLPLNGGDIILVHSVHTNGWADGTLLSSGARGWLPTNYCEGYGSEPINNLMRALTVFWDLAQGSNVDGLSVFQNSDYVRGLVAGVRCLLESTNCLNRESSLIQSHNVLRKNRKVLLSDLSSFVKITKGLESLLENSSESLEVELDLDEMIMKAFTIVTRAARFLDEWEELMQSIDLSSGNFQNMQVPPTPPAEKTTFGIAHHDREIASLSSSHLNEANNVDEERDCLEQTKGRPRYSRASQTYVRPGSSNSCRPLSKLSHRVSCNVHPGSRNLASEKLSDLHNSFLTCLGYFIGLHIQSRSSSEILLTTKQAVVSCRDMLEVVGDIWERDWRRSASLQESRDNMYRKIADLAEAAKDIFKPLKPGEDDEVILPSEGNPLVEAATACVRAAGECVCESRLVIERIGDFDFEPLGLGIADFEQTKIASPEALDPVDEEQRAANLNSSNLPLQPSSEPPPPPNLQTPKNDLPIASAMSTTVPSIELSSITTDFNVSATQDDNSGSLLPPLPAFSESLLPPTGDSSSSSSPIDSIHGSHASPVQPSWTLGLENSSSGEGCTYTSSTLDSETSSGSTRATSPDTSFAHAPGGSTFCNNSNGSQSTLFAESEEDEAKVHERTFAHELVYNKEGQISGGTLPALIERLTTHDSTPDATFVSTFYLTFRLFATPATFAQALIDRFQYVGESPRIAGPVRLRVYNVFKGWLESHWRIDCDGPALELIVPFATRQLQIVLPTAGKRLATLASKVTAANGPLVPRLISSMGKTNTSIATYVPPDTPLPPPIITKSQIAALRNWKLGNGDINIVDFDPLELARQFTIKKSQIFCSILPEELLATEWMKKSGSMAVNVRQMSRLSTDLTNLVADCILQLEDIKKRAIIIKQWVKIATKLLDLANYDSLMAIICALDSSTIQRLKRTWDLVSTKTKTKLEHIKSVVDISKNYTVLRQRLQNQVPPCLPFVGTYLTDLTFVDVGNQTTRQLPGEGIADSKSVINFDKHMKTAKIISELQRFQIPYRFTEIPELQTWMQDQLVRVRTSDECNMTNHYRRSLLLEPREQVQYKSSPVEPQSSTSSGKEKFELFGIGWSHHSREKLAGATS
ncbi:Ras guanine nucleotide exchange factor bud5 [Lecanora helva]